MKRVRCGAFGQAQDEVRPERTLTTAGSARKSVTDVEGKTLTCTCHAVPDGYSPVSYGVIGARGEKEAARLTPEITSQPACAKSSYFFQRLTSDWSPGETPRTRKGNQTNRSLKSVRKPGRWLSREGGGRVG